MTIEDEGRGIPLVSAVASHNRGAELSELQFYNGKVSLARACSRDMDSTCGSLFRLSKQMLTVDDRTGIVYEIVGNNLAARHILADGDGQTSRCMLLRERG